MVGWNKGPKKDVSYFGKQPQVLILCPKACLPNRAQESHSRFLGYILEFVYTTLSLTFFGTSVMKQGQTCKQR